MPTVFSKFSRQNFPNFIADFIQDFRNSANGKDFFDTIENEYEKDILCDEEMQENKRRRLNKTNEEDIDYSNTNWGKFIVDPAVNDHQSRKGKLFRRRFRYYEYDKY